MYFEVYFCVFLEVYFIVFPSTIMFRIPIEYIFDLKKCCISNVFGHVLVDIQNCMPVYYHPCILNIFSLCSAEHYYVRQSITFQAALCALHWLDTEAVAPPHLCTHEVVHNPTWFSSRIDHLNNLSHLLLVYDATQPQCCRLGCMCDTPRSLDFKPTHFHLLPSHNERAIGVGLAHKICTPPSITCSAWMPLELQWLALILQ